MNLTGGMTAPSGFSAAFSLAQVHFLEARALWEGEVNNECNCFPTVKGTSPYADAG
jgi:hypothetical protein